MAIPALSPTCASAHCAPADQTGLGGGSSVGAGDCRCSGWACQQHRHLTSASKPHQVKEPDSCAAAVRPRSCRAQTRTPRPMSVCCNAKHVANRDHFSVIDHNHVYHMFTRSLHHIQTVDSYGSVWSPRRATPQQAGHRLADSHSSPVRQFIALHHVHSTSIGRCLSTDCVVAPVQS